MGDGCYCACLRISWRTRENDDGSTSGWWECNSGCGSRFVPRKLAEHDADALREKLRAAEAMLATVKENLRAEKQASAAAEAKATGWAEAQKIWEEACLFQHERADTAEAQRDALALLLARAEKYFNSIGVVVAPKSVPMLTEALAWLGDARAALAALSARDGEGK